MPENNQTQTILVVDDDPKIVRLVRSYLEQSGFHVESAEDGELALQAIRTIRPDLIILDLMLPGRDGLSITRIVRADPTLGVARWSGQADLTYFSSGSPTTVVVNSRFTMRPSDLSGPLAMKLGSSLGITDSGAVLPVQDDYQVNLLAEIFWTGAWRPATDLFNSLQTVSGHHVVVNLYDSFFYTDREITDLAAYNDGPTELGTTTALSATVSAGTHISYTWSFGDSTSGTGITPTHTYAAPGAYTATVEASNTASIVTTTTIVYVDEPISALMASNSGPALLGESTMLSATIGSGSNVTFAWNCGDGQNASGATLSHDYMVSGTYTATITASNSLGSATATTIVIVEEPNYPSYLPLILR